jgi:hypothetical protein
MDRQERLEEQIRVMQGTIDRLHQRLAALESGGTAATATETAPSTRRGFLRLGAAAAVGAVGLAAGRVLPATAADGDPINAGQTTLAESSTTLKTDTTLNPPAKVLGVEDKLHDDIALGNAGGFAGTLQGLGGSGAVEGVDGWAQGPSSFGVYGLTDTGFGVVGESNTGISLYARRSGRIQQDPLADTPQNSIPTPGSFETVRDSNGAMWISGPGNTWMRPSLNSFANPRRVVGQAMVKGVTYGPFDATVKIGGGSSGVPAGAQAAYCAVQSYSPGVLTLYPDLAADTGTANYSGTGTAGTKLNMLYVLVPLSSAGKFKIHSYITGNVYVDVWGFLI